MFDLGFWELLFVGIIALVVLGPERLPVAARAVGRWVGKARAYTRSLSNELNREVQLNEMRDKVRAAEASFRQGVNSAGNEIRKLEKPDPDAGFKPVPLAPETPITTEPSAKPQTWSESSYSPSEAVPDSDDTAPAPSRAPDVAEAPELTATDAAETTQTTKRSASSDIEGKRGDKVDGSEEDAVEPPSPPRSNPPA